MAAKGLPDFHAQPSLPDQLRKATRQGHHALNTQIIARLPLCLPPSAESPLNYAKGMLIFGQIYFAFEGFLTTQLASTYPDPRLLKMYDRIHLPPLLRTDRLRHDIAVLKLRLSDVEVAELETLEADSENLCLRIRSSISANPHVLLGYAWTMYLALFNGGRWIRKQFVSAGNTFWRGEALPLSFWEFDEKEGAQVDGESLKDAFKYGFLEAASNLTEDEIRDVVREAVRLFDLCIEMIKSLDRKTTSNVTNSMTESQPPLPLLVDSAQAKPYINAYAFADTVRRCAASTFALLKTTARTSWKNKVAWPG